MRILYVINSLGAGGAERSLVELLPGVRSAGIEVLLAPLSRRPEGFHDEVIAQGVDVRSLGNGGYPSTLMALRSLIRRERPDIVHTTLFEADLMGRLAAVGRPVRVISSLVNTGYDEAVSVNRHVPAWKLRSVRLLDGLTARHLTHGFHAISEAARESGVRHLGIAPDRVTVVHRGRDPERLGSPSLKRRREVRERWGIEQDALLVTNVGRQEPQKDQATLIRAVAVTRPRFPEFMTVIVGRRGAASEELSRLVLELGLQDRVRIVDYASDVPDLLAASDVFAFPSRYEGLGGALLEAMALGLPSVVSKIPALMEVVGGGRGALAVEPSDPHGLATALETLLGDAALRHRLGVAARANFLDRFTLERSTSLMIDLYAQVVAL